MRLSAGQYAIRLSCGLGLLLVPAVQAKLCSRPVASVVPPSAAPVTPIAPSDEAKQRQKKKKPLTLAATVPDVLMPRWPSHTHLTSVQRVRPLPVATWMDAPANADTHPSVDFGGALAACWSRRPISEVLPALSGSDLRSHRAHQHVFQTSILRTGPPRA